MDDETTQTCTPAQDDASFFDQEADDAGATYDPNSCGADAPASYDADPATSDPNAPGAWAKPAPIPGPESMPSIGPMSPDEQAAWNRERADQKTIENCDTLPYEARSWCKSARGVGPGAGLPRPRNFTGPMGNTLPQAADTPVYQPAIR